MNVRIWLLSIVLVGCQPLVAEVAAVPVVVPDMAQKRIPKAEPVEEKEDCPSDKQIISDVAEQSEPYVRKWRKELKYFAVEKQRKKYEPDFCMSRTDTYDKRHEYLATVFANYKWTGKFWRLVYIE